MKERPIIFSGTMVRAILEGRKTQTRRVVKHPLPESPTKIDHKRWGLIDGNFYYCGAKFPYGQPGDRLWVRETWCKPRTGLAMHVVHFRADESLAPDEFYKWRPSIYMPRWASRITLEITGVRVERLQGISEEDAKAEGCTNDDDPCWKQSYADPDSGGSPSFRNSFQWLWDSINGKKHPWKSNPWVWVIEFKKI